MTQTDPTPRSLEELRVKVAELCGARWMLGFHGYRFLSFAPIREPSDDWNFAKGDEPIANPLFEGWDIPNYPSDLNACAEFEKRLVTSQQQNAYQAVIAELCYADDTRSDNQVVFNQLTATAEQRCRAFVALHEGMK